MGPTFTGWGWLRACVALVVALACAWPTQGWAQSDEEEAPADADQDEAAPAPESPASEPAEAEQAPEGSSKEAAEAPLASPSPNPVSAPATDMAPTGAIVVALSAAARPHARSLARAVYADHVLRPTIDEATAQVLSGGEPPEDQPALKQHASLVNALTVTEDDEVRRRLAGSLGRDLHARLVVLVSVREGEPTARVIRMPEEQLLAVKLTANRQEAATPTASPTWTWQDATSMLRELSIGSPPPGPRKKAAGGTTLPTPEPDEGEDDGNLLTSPWFWGGLGLVVTVGATVLILSQTALNEPDTVMIGGRVTP
jgi:nucleotide-binding universal stress UspA family protein